MQFIYIYSGPEDTPIEVFFSLGQNFGSCLGSCGAQSNDISNFHNLTCDE